MLVCLLCATAFAEDTRIPILISPSASPEKDAPIFVGVPFPKNLINAGTAVRVIDEAGAPVPSASRVMALWPETDSVRWLGVDFIGDPTKRYFVTPGQPVEPAQPLHVEQQEETWRVSTGAARFTVAADTLLAEAGLSETPLLKNTPGDGLYVIDNQGREARAMPESLQLETVSPLRATFRLEGWYATPEGEKLARHITRLHFFAGKTYFRVEHSLVLTQSTDKVWFREYGLRMRHATPPSKVIFPESDKPDAQEISIATDGGEVFLFQEKAFEYSRMDEARDCAFVIGKNGETLRTGTLAGNWMQAGAVGVAMRNFWQTFPKELRSTPERLEVRLWSPRGGEELDFRMDTLRKRIPEEWLADSIHSKEEVENARTMQRDAQGVARSHEILIDLAPEAARLRAFGEKTVAIADPAWLRHSEAMGRLHPYDPRRFPGEEEFMEAWFDQHMAIYDQWGEFGFFNYGGGPHVWFRKSKDKPLMGRWIPYVQRYPLDYGFHAHVWRMFARSGNRKYFDVAERMTRHRLDLGMVHWPGHRKLKGTYQTIASGPASWGASSLFHMQSGTDIRGFAYLYYLTDFRPAREMLEAYGKAVKEVWNSGDQGPLRGTRPFASLKNLATVWQETGDPELKSIVQEQTRWLADVNAPQGVAEERERTGLAKYGVKSGAMQRVAEVMDDEVAIESLVKGATTIASEPSGKLPFAYYNSVGEQVSEAYHRTGDPLFARALACDMALAVSYYRSETGRGWKPMHPELGPVSAFSVYPLGGMAFAMDAVVEYEKREGRPVEAVPFARQTGEGEKVPAVFEKPAGRAVKIDVRSTHPLAPRVLTPDGHVVENIGREVFIDQLRTREAIPTRVVLTVPEELAAGAYLIDPGADGAPWEVTWTDAPKLVLFAPDGLTAGAKIKPLQDVARVTPDTSIWSFFQVPQGTASFDVSTTGSLHLRQPDGKTIFLRDRQTGEFTESIPVPEGMDGKLWSFRAAAPRFVRFHGIPPFFAYGDEERYFAPKLKIKP